MNPAGTSSRARGGRHTRRRLAPSWPAAPLWRDDEGMRYESCITSLSWIPSEAVTGGTRVAFDAGFTHYDDPPPDRIDDIEALRATDKFRFANVLRAWVEVDASGADHRLRLRRRRHDGLDHRPARRAELPVPGGPAPRHPAGAGTRRRVGPVRADRRGPDRAASAAAGAPQAVRPVAGTAGVDHAVADPARGRDGRVRDDRRQPVPAALDLRRQGRALAQVRADRLRRLVPQVVRPAHPVGRRGLQGPGDRRGDGAGAGAVRPAHARRRASPRSAA